MIKKILLLLLFVFLCSCRPSPTTIVTVIKPVAKSGAGLVLIGAVIAAAVVYDKLTEDDFDEKEED